MTKEPRSKEEIYNSLRSSLTGKIKKLTNFTERSFNFVWTQAFSEEISEVELRAHASELAGYIDYAGGPVTEEQLEDLGIEGVDVEKLNEFMDDEDLDRLVEIVGVTRDPGTRATGEVTFSTTSSSSVTINEETVVTTEPNTDGETLDFETTEEITVGSGDTTGTASIQATEVGEEYNIPADSIIRVANPPVGVRGANNTSSTSGGSGVETNDELRERSKGVVSGQSNGGTVEGIKGAIRETIEDVSIGDIKIDEDFSKTEAEVIVDGGSDSEVKSVIEKSRPTAIEHFLVRPSGIQISIDTSLVGSDIDLSSVRQDVQKYLLDLGLSDSFYNDEIIERIMTSDDGIINIEQLDINIKEVTNERHTYDGSTYYKLDYTYDGGSSLIVDSSGQRYTEGSHYNIVDNTNDSDSYVDSVDWSIGGSTPDNGETFFVDYTVNAPLRSIREEVHTHKKDETESFTYESTKSEYRLSEVPFVDSAENEPFINDNSGDTYSLSNNDFDIISSTGEEVVDEFVYQSGRTLYELDHSTEQSIVSIEDENGTTYSPGVEFVLADNDSDGIDETIDWSGGTSSDNPAAEEEFTVTYEVQNGIPETITWNNSPDNGEEFTVTYDKKVYELEYEVTQTSQTGSIVDETGSTFSKNTDWEFEDVSGTGEVDSIAWNDVLNTPSDGNEFYINYINERDRKFDKDQKAEPGDITVTNR